MTASGHMAVKVLKSNNIIYLTSKVISNNWEILITLILESWMIFGH